jgi:hypothetical protein
LKKGVPSLEIEWFDFSTPAKGTPMKTFLQRMSGVVSGILSGFDRLIFKGKLRQLYSPEGMNCYCTANQVLRKEYKAHAKEVTYQVLQASLIELAKKLDRFRFLNSSQIDKEQVARTIAAEQRIQEGLVCVLQCVESCWTFDLKSIDGRLTVQGEPGKCSKLYHYYLHPEFGWMHVRLQTWFPFEIQVYLNGREWLARQLEREGLKYQRSDNKFLWVQDWPRAQALFTQQLQTAWPTVLDELQRQVHPLHPGHLGRLPVAYNWTVFQSEWATDVAFHSRQDLEQFYARWVRHAFLNFDSMKVLRFLGRAGRLVGDGPDVYTNLERFFEGTRLKHWADHNSLKLYDHLNVLRPETTINDPSGFRVYRTAENDPEGPQAWRPLRRGVADLHRRAEVSQAANERYLAALAGVAETQTVKELAEPLCRRVTEPGQESSRKVRALNPLAADDAALLQAISDPKWMVSGLRNRDLVAVLYPRASDDPTEKRRRSARATRLLRLLRAHGLLQKVPRTHRYQVSAQARTTILALLAAADANPEKLTTNAA